MAQVSVGRNHPFGAIGTPDAPRRTGFGSAGVLEVVEDHRGDTYRAVYTVKFAAPQRATQSAYMVRPGRASFLRREGLKGLLPYIRAVCAAGTAAHDGYSRPRFPSPLGTQGTGTLPECPQPGVTFVPSLRF